MKNQSRTSQVDTEKCVRNVGGNKFELILIAAQRAREIKRENGKDLPVITALLEIQEEKLDTKKYLMKVK